MKKITLFALLCIVVCAFVAAGSALCSKQLSRWTAVSLPKTVKTVRVADASASAAPGLHKMPWDTYTIPETKNTISVTFQREQSEHVILDVNGDNSDKLWDMPDILFSKQRLPDLRLYSVNVDKTGNEIRNRIHFAKLSDTDTYKYGSDVTVRDNPKYVMYDIGDHFASMYRKDPAGFQKKFTPGATDSPGAGLRLERWDIEKQAKEYIEECERNVREGRSSLAPPLGFNKYLEVLKDPSGKVLWSSSRQTFLYADKLGNGYVLISSAGVYFVSIDNVSTVYYNYEKGFLLPVKGGKGALVPPVSAQLLSDNIVRVKYKDGAEADWRILLSYKDYINNKNKERYPAASLVWYNGQKPLNTYYLAWDTASGASKKPVYKETMPSYVSIAADPGYVPGPFGNGERRKSDVFAVKDCVNGKFDTFRHGDYNRWKEMPVFMQPKTRHIADTGVYTMSVYSFKGLTKNVCRFDKRSSFAAVPEDIIINRREASDLLDHFAYIYLESPAAFRKSFGSAGRRSVGEGVYLESFSIRGKAEEYVKARKEKLPDFWTHQNYTDSLEVLSDAGGKTLWASSVAKVLDVRKTDKTYAAYKYVVLTTDGAVYINVDDNGAVRADEYRRTFAADGILENGQKAPAVKSGRMINDLKAEITYDNGFTVRYMARLRTRDLEANLNRSKDPGASVVWNNEKYNIREKAMGWEGLDEPRITDEGS